MGKTVTLKHTLHRMKSRTEFFYDGIEVARDGLLTLPVDNFTRIEGAFFRGYQLTPEGRHLGRGELDGYVREAAAEVSPDPEPVQTAESAEEETTDEGIDDRRQSDTEHRVRSRKRKSRTKTTK